MTNEKQKEPAEQITYCNVTNCIHCLQTKADGLKVGICKKANRCLKPCSMDADNVVACLDFKEKE